MIEISEAIRFYRKQSGLTQSQLACKLGVQQVLISQWENSIRSPSPAQITAMEQVFSLKKGELMEIYCPSDLPPLDYRKPIY